MSNGEYYDENIYEGIHEATKCNELNTAHGMWLANTQGYKANICPRMM